MNNQEQSGKKANRNGKILEEMLIPTFINHGYFYINEKIEYTKKNGDTGYKDKYSKREMENIKNEKEKYFIKDVEYTSIYKHKSRTEFLVVNKRLNRKFRIECKWQQSNGSVDEKLPYLYLNCIFAFEENEVIIVIDGKGQKQGAIDWIKEKANSNWLNEDGKTIRVMNLTEFTTWFSNLNSIPSKNN